MFSICLLFIYLFLFIFPCGQTMTERVWAQILNLLFPGKDFLRCCSWLLSFWQARWCVRVGHSPVRLHPLRSWQGAGCLVGFQTQQLCVGHTSCPFLTSTTAVLLKAAVPRSLLFSICKQHPYFYSCPNQAPANSNIFLIVTAHIL